jgi:class 3 adenylate cyclase
MFKNTIVDEFIFINRKISENFASIATLKEFEDTVVKVALDYTKSLSGFIALSERGKSTYKVTNLYNFDLASSDLNLNTNVLSKLFTKDKSNTKILNNTFLKEIGDIKSMLVSKLKIKDEIAGYIFLFEKKEKVYFEESDRLILEILSLHASAVLDKIEVIDKIRFENEGVKKLQRYLPKKLISKLFENKQNPSLVGKTEDATVVLCSIYDFNQILEKIDTDKVMQLLNEYFTVMTRVVFSFNGSINKFVGDDIMAVFGAPFYSPNASTEAVLASIEMKRQSDKLKEKFKKELGIDDFGIKIAVNSGSIIYGNVGTTQRMEFTAIGNVVSTTGRLQAYAEKNNIALGQNTYEKVKNIVNVIGKKNIPMDSETAGFLSVYKIEDTIQDQLFLESQSQIKSEYSVREHVRLPLRTPVSVIKKGVMNQGIIKDLSLGGACVKSEGDFKEGDILLLNFRFGSDLEFVDVKALVKHVAIPKKKDKSNYLTLGLKFLNLSDNDYIKMVNFIDNKLLSMR